MRFRRLGNNRAKAVAVTVFAALAAFSIASAARPITARPAHPFPATSPATSPANAPSTARKPRANELTLAGLRPGRDTRAMALARFHKPWAGDPDSEPDSDTSAVWRDLCRNREVRMDFGENDVIESITVSIIAGPIYDCAPGASGAPGAATMPMEAWRTGRCLSLGELRSRVLVVYGPPESQGPSSEQGDEAEFLYYAFDWAGSEVPQVLEVTCNKKSGRVVQITLAAESL